MKKTTAAFALCAATFSLAACTTSDPTPPGSVAGLIDAEEGDEEEGIPEVDELDPSAEVASETEEPGESAEMTEAPADSAEITEEPAEGEAAAGMPDAASMSDPSCKAFFEGAAPLAARATDAREFLAAGAESSLSALDYAEIGVIVGRVDAIGTEATGAQTPILERINAPFIELVQAAQAGGQNEESGEVTFDAIDTTDSEAAQEEFTEACVGAPASE